MTKYPLQQHPAPVGYYSATREGRDVESVVLHYTGTYDYNATVSGFVRSRPKGRRVSTHFVIGREPGEACIMVPLNFAAWHAGNRDMNMHSIGIEIVNLGGMNREKRNGRYYRDDSDVYVELKPRNGVICEPFGPYDYYEKYNDWQYCAVSDICGWLMTAFDVGLQDIIGHSDVSPGRKFDPGPAFNWDRFKTQAIEAYKYASVDDDLTISYMDD